MVIFLDNMWYKGIITNNVCALFNLSLSYLNVSNIEILFSCFALRDTHTFRLRQLPVMAGGKLNLSCYNKDCKNTLLSF